MGPPSDPTSNTSFTPTDAETAFVGVARLALWVGLAYALLGGAAIPVFVSVINWRARFVGREAWYLATEVVASGLTAAGGVLIGWAGFSALWRGAGFLRTRGMVVGAGLAIAAEVCQIALYAFFTLRWGTAWTPTAMANLLLATGRYGVIGMPAVAVMWLARSRDVAALRLVVTPAATGGDA